MRTNGFKNNPVNPFILLIDSELRKTSNFSLARTVIPGFISRHSPVPTGESPVPRFCIRLVINQFWDCFGEISPKRNKKILTINKL